MLYALKVGKTPAQEEQEIGGVSDSRKLPVNFT